MTNTYEIIGLEEFANKCEFVLNGNVLTTRCHLRDVTGEVYSFERSTDLGPAIDLVARNLAAWHAQQHGEEPTVSGWTDYVKQAVSTVKKVAQNKTVRSIYEQAKPFLKTAVKELPGGETAMEVATKASKLYEKARKGSKQATEAVKKIKELAQTGEKKAEYAIKVMTNVKAILDAKAAGIANPVLPAVEAAVRRRGGASYYNLGVTAVSGWEIEDEDEDVDIGKRGRRVKRGKARASAPPSRGMAYQTRRPAPGLARGFRDMARPTMSMSAAAPQEQVPAPLAAEAVRVPTTSNTQTTSDMPSEHYDEQALDQMYGVPDVDGGDYGDFEVDAESGFVEDCGDNCEEVSGWTYNRGYRTVSQSLLQSQKSPGVGNAARELYNRGLGRPRTSLSTLASQAFKMF